MHPSTIESPTPPSGTNCPTAHDGAVFALAMSETSDSAVGRIRHGNSVIERAAAAVLAMSAGRTISDQELRQHALDCTYLMERAYERYQRFAAMRLPVSDRYGDEERAAAVAWMRLRDEALKALSPQWKAAREAQIQQDITRGQDYFVAAGDEARVALAGRNC